MGTKLGHKNYGGTNLHRKFFGIYHNLGHNILVLYNVSLQVRVATSKTKLISSINLVHELPNNLKFMISANLGILENSEIWLETQFSVQSPSHKSNFGNSSQKTCKSRYQTLLFLCIFTRLLQLVQSILSGIVDILYYTGIIGNIINMKLITFLYFWKKIHLKRETKCVIILKILSLSLFNTLSSFSFYRITYFSQSSFPIPNFVSDCMFFSCHVHISEWIHTPQLPECQGTPCTEQPQNLNFK